MPFVTKRTHKVGCCSKCGTSNINYGFVELDGDMLYYPIRCLDCGNTGKEWYNVKYCETIMEILV